MKLLAALAGAVLAFGVTPTASAEVYSDGKVQATVGATAIELSNGLVSRRWTRTPFRTQSLTDFRGGILNAVPRWDHAGGVPLVRDACTLADRAFAPLTQTSGWGRKFFAVRIGVLSGSDSAGVTDTR